MYLLVCLYIHVHNIHVWMGLLLEVACALGRCLVDWLLACWVCVYVVLCELACMFDACMMIDDEL